MSSNLGRESSALTAIAVHAILSTSSRAMVACKSDRTQRCEDVLDETVPCGREILNPAICDLTAHICSESTRAEFGVNAAAPVQRTLVFVLGRKERKGRCGSARLDIIRRLRTSHPAATSCPNRPVTRNSFALIRVHPWFQNAIHRRSDELDPNPRSVVPSIANDPAQQRRGTGELEVPETNHGPPSAAAPGPASPRT